MAPLALLLPVLLLLVITAFQPSHAQTVEKKESSALQSSASEFFFQRAMNQTGAEKYEAALKSLNQSLQAWPTARAYRSRAAILMRQGEIEPALADYASAIELEPDAPYHYQIRAVVLQTIGQHEEAIEDYGMVIELRPQHHKAWGNRGLALMEIGELERAMKDLDRAIEIAPDYDIGLYNRGLAKYNLGDFVGAVEDFKSALLQKPDWEDALFNLRLAEEKLKKSEAKAAATEKSGQRN